MAITILQRRADLYIPSHAEIIRDHPLAPTLSACLTSQFGHVVDLLKRRRAATTVGSSDRLQRGLAAQGWEFSQAETAELDWTSGAFAALIFFRITATPANNEYPDILRRATYVSEANQKGWAFYGTPPNDGLQNKYIFTIYRDNGSSAGNNASTTTLSVGDHVLIGYSDGSANKGMFLDGKQESLSSSGGNFAPLSDTANGLRMTNALSKHWLYLAYIWHGGNGTWPQFTTLMRELSNDPFQLVNLRKSPKYFLISPATTAQTVTGSAGIVSGETFGTGGTIGGPVTGTAGIASAEAFGIGGVTGGPIAGTTGIPSGEAFGAGGEVQQILVTGVTGIKSAEKFGKGGGSVDFGNVGGPLQGTSGIASAETFGAGGVVAGPVTGSAGIPSGETFGQVGVATRDGELIGANGIVSAEAFGGDGSVIQILPGSAGIPTGEAFGAGIVSGPIVGDLGIPSGELFGAGGNILTVGQLLTGSAGIASSLTFGSGGIVAVTIVPAVGGIGSAEKFGSLGIVLVEAAPGAGVSKFILMIASRDRNAYYSMEDGLNGIRIFRSLNSRGTAQFKLIDRAGTFRPQIGDPVAFLENGVLRFAGTIEEWDEMFYNGTSAMLIDVACSDWGVILDRRIIGKTYKAADYGTLTSVVTGIINDYLAADGISFLSLGDPAINIGDQEFNWITASEALGRLAQLTGWDYIIDANKVLRFFDPAVGIGNASFSLANDDSNWRSMHVRRRRGDYRNVQYVRSSQQIGGLMEDRFSAQSALPCFTLRSQPSPRPDYTNPVTGGKDYAIDMSVTVNGAASGRVTQMGDWLSGWTWVYDKEFNRVCYNTALSPIGIGSEVIITYPTEETTQPVIREANDAEIATRKAIEGGSGLYEAVEDARDVEDLGAQQQLARGLLERQGDNGMPISIDVETDKAWLDPGQRWSVSTTKPLAAGSFVINTVETSEIAGKFLRHKVNAQIGPHVGNFLQKWEALARRSKSPRDRSRERAILLLAKSVKGLTNPGLAVGANVTDVPYSVQKSGTIVEVRCGFTVSPAQNNDLIIDVLVDGLTIFSNAAKITVPKTKTQEQVVRNFRETPLKVSARQKVTVNVLQGDTTARDGYVTVEIAS